MFKKEKEKFFLFASIGLAIAGFLIWFGVVNINANINNSVSELKEKKVSVDAYVLRGQLLGEELKAYSFSKNEIRKINNFFIYADDNDDEEFTSFFGQLDDIALQSTQKEKSLVIDLYQRAPVAVKKSSTSEKVPVDTAANQDGQLFKLTLQSSYKGLIKFISYLEAMPYYIYIDSVNINISNGTAATKNINQDILTDDPVNLQSVLVIKVFRRINTL